MDTRIRLMHPNDYPLLRDLWARTPGMGLNPYDDSEEGIRRYLRRNPTTSFVAMDGGTMVGAIMAGHDGRRGFLYHAAVDSTHQGSGLGRRLVEAALEALNGEGIAKVSLVALADNATGNAFWDHLGFTARPDLVYRNRALR